MNGRAVRVVSLVLLFVAGWTASGKDKDPWKDMSVEVGDIKIHYLEAGTGDRVLVFIPGWTMAAEIWKEQIPYFSSRGFRVIALDPRSHGQSTKTEAGNTYLQHAADLHAFLQALEIEHSYLVGWSSGVATLLDYISSPESLRPEKLVLVDGNPAPLKSDEYPGVTTVQQARKLILGLGDARGKAIEQYVRSLFKQRPAESLVTEIVAASRKTPLSAALSLYFDLFTGDRTPALLHVSVPTLIVTTPESSPAGEYMKAKISRSSLEVIDGAGSAMFLDKPQTFNQILENFLGEH